MKLLLTLRFLDCTPANVSHSFSWFLDANSVWLSSSLSQNEFVDGSAVGMGGGGLISFVVDCKQRRCCLVVWMVNKDSCLLLMILTCKWSCCWHVNEIVNEIDTQKKAPCEQVGKRLCSVKRLEMQVLAGFRRTNDRGLKRTRRDIYIYICI